jgi:hypothetical protein
MSTVVRFSRDSFALLDCCSLLDLNCLSPVIDRLAYKDLSWDYNHFSVNHSIGEYSKRDYLPSGKEFDNTSNHIEGVWGEFKSSAHSHSHRQLEKLDLIMDEIMFRHSRRNLFHVLRAEYYKGTKTLQLASAHCKRNENPSSSDPSLFSF